MGNGLGRRLIRGRGGATAGRRGAGRSGAGRSGFHRGGSGRNGSGRSGFRRGGSGRSGAGKSGTGSSGSGRSGFGRSGFGRSGSRWQRGRGFGSLSNLERRVRRAKFVGCTLASFCRDFGRFCRIFASYCCTFASFCRTFASFCRTLGRLRRPPARLSRLNPARILSSTLASLSRALAPGGRRCLLALPAPALAAPLPRLLPQLWRCRWLLARRLLLGALPLARRERYQRDHAAGAQLARRRREPTVRPRRLPLSPSRWARRPKARLLFRRRVRASPAALSPRVPRNGQHARRRMRLGRLVGRHLDARSRPFPAGSPSDLGRRCDRRHARDSAAVRRGAGLRGRLRPVLFVLGLFAGRGSRRHRLENRLLGMLKRRRRRSAALVLLAVLLAEILAGPGCGGDGDGHQLGLTRRRGRGRVRGQDWGYFSRPSSCLAAAPRH